MFIFYVSVLCVQDHFALEGNKVDLIVFSVGFLFLILDLISRLCWWKGRLWLDFEMVSQRQTPRVPVWAHAFQTLPDRHGGEGQRGCASGQARAFFRPSLLGLLRLPPFICPVGRASRPNGLFGMERKEEANAAVTWALLFHSLRSLWQRGRGPGKMRPFSLDSVGRREAAGGPVVISHHSGRKTP